MTDHNKREATKVLDRVLAQLTALDEGLAVEVTVRVHTSGAVHTTAKYRPDCTITADLMQAALRSVALAASKSDDEALEALTETGEAMRETWQERQLDTERDPRQLRLPMGTAGDA